MLCVTLIAAISEDGYISKGTGIPWHLPADIAHFRQVTEGKWLLLGRRTYEEMQGWFKPDHTPLVLTHSPLTQGPGQAVASLAEALELAKQQPELVVCGGGQIFEAAMPHATKLWVTRVQTQLHDGIPFPAIDPAQWRVVSSRHHTADEAHAHGMEFVCMERL